MGVLLGKRIANAVALCFRDGWRKTSRRASSCAFQMFRVVPGGPRCGEGPVSGGGVAVSARGPG